MEFCRVSRPGVPSRDRWPLIGRMPTCLAIPIAHTHCHTANAIGDHFAPVYFITHTFVIHTERSVPSWRRAVNPRHNLPTFHSIFTLQTTMCRPKNITGVRLAPFLFSLTCFGGTTGQIWAEKWCNVTSLSTAWQQHLGTTS